MKDPKIRYDGQPLPPAYSMSWHNRLEHLSNFPVIASQKSRKGVSS